MFHKNIPIITTSVYSIVFYFIIFYSSLFHLNKQTYIHTYSGHNLIMTCNPWFEQNYLKNFFKRSAKY